MNTKNWIILTIVLAIVATVLQLAGFVTPMWIWLDIGQFQVGVGLWSRTGCGIDDTCNTTATVAFGYAAEDTYETAEFKAVQALQALGLAGGVLVVLFLVVYRVGFGSWNEMGALNMVAFVASIFAWLVIVIGLIVYCAFYWPVVGTSPLHNKDSFPWSFLMCFSAALLFIIISVLIRIKCRDRDFLKHAIPTSGDSKMDLNPVTKHGLQHRYFTPLNYNEDRRNHMGFGLIDESIQKRLISSEHHAAGVDNLALQGNTVENGVHYRYLTGGIQNGGVVQNTETVVKRSLPTAVVTYDEEAHHNNLNTNTNDVHHQRGFSDTRHETVNHTTYTTNVINNTNTTRNDAANHYHRFSNGGNNNHNNDNRALLRRSTSAGSDRQAEAVRHRDSFNVAYAYNENRGTAYSDHRGAYSDHRGEGYRDNRERGGGLVRSGSTGNLVQEGDSRVYSADYTSAVRRQDYTTNNAYQAYANENRGLVRSNSMGSLRQRQLRGGGGGEGRYQGYEGQVVSDAYHRGYNDKYGRGLVRSGSLGSLAQDGRMTQDQASRNVHRVSSSNAFNSEFQSNQRRGLVRSASFGSQGVGYQRADSASVMRGGGGVTERYGGEVTYTTVTQPVSYVTRREVRQYEGSQIRGAEMKSLADADVDENHPMGDGRSLQQFTTHTRMGRQTTLAPRFYPTGSSVKLYDPTYIYRPYSEQIY